jgi:hypothetical protein
MLKRAIRLVLAALALLTALYGPMAVSPVHADCAGASTGTGGCPD